MNIFIACSSRLALPKYMNLAKEISNQLAREDHNLVFGAASSGMMGLCYQQFHERGRKIYAYTVKEYESDLDNLKDAEKWVVETTFDRIKKIYHRADCCLFLPGGSGTVSEFEACLEETRTTKDEKPLLLCNVDHFFDYEQTSLSKKVELGLNDPTILNHFEVFDSQEKVLAKIRRIQKQSIYL